MRILPPLIFWTVFYLVWREYVGGEHLHWRKCLIILVRGTPYSHLYFLFVLAGLYAITPVLRVVTRAATARELKYASSLLLTLAAGMCILEGGLKRGSFSLPVEPMVLNWFVPYIGYFLLGYLWRQGGFLGRMLVADGAVFTLMVATSALGYGALTLAGQPERAQTICSNYFSIPIIVMSVVAFPMLVTICSHSWPRPVAWLRSRWLGSAVFGIYLVHPAILDGVMRVPTVRQLSGPLQILVAFLAVTVGSFGVTGVVRLIPFLRRVVG